ncbi:nfnB, partial [Symbiodinium sp. CCMP2456]
MASSNLSLYVLFAIGDVVAHVGLMTIVYWDICMEAVLLIYALAPLHQRIGYIVSTWVGAMSVASQVLFLIPFWTLMYQLPIGSTRNFLAGTFFVVQCFTIFGIIPAAGFTVLAHGARKLRGKLPASIPRHLTHRLRFTQLGIAIFILMGVADALFALIPATQPYIRRFSSFLYINLVLTSLAIFTFLLLAVELYLNIQQMRSTTVSPIPLQPHALANIVKHGVSMLARDGQSHTPAAVWERGVLLTVATGFGDILEAKNILESKSGLGETTSDLCVELLRPLTEEARCSAWEGLYNGLEFQSSARTEFAVSPKYVGKPTVMVSHCWASPYSQLMAILKRYDENTNRNNFFWIDVFSMNQHDFANLSGKNPSDIHRSASVYDTMLVALTRSIKVPGRMLLALTPHEQPSLLSRAWCLYEIYIAWTVGAEVCCGFVPEAEQSVKRSLLRDDVLINQMLDSVDAEKSRATVESDRAMIMDLIAAAGISNFNSFVRKQLQASLRMLAVTTLLKIRTADSTNVEAAEVDSTTVEAAEEEAPEEADPYALVESIEPLAFQVTFGDVGFHSEALWENASQNDLNDFVKGLSKEEAAKLAAALQAREVAAPLGIREMSALHATHSFNPSKEIPRQVVKDILEGLRSVPSSANTQPWTIVVVQGATRKLLSEKIVAKFDAGEQGTALYADLPKDMPARMQKAVDAYTKEYDAFLGDDKAKLRKGCEFFGAPLHLVVCAPKGPCLEESPPVDGVFLDMGSAMTAMSFSAFDLGLGVHPQFSLAKYNDIYKEEKMPDDHFVICGLSVGYLENDQDPRKTPGFQPSKLSVDDTTRWVNCDGEWLKTHGDAVTGNSEHGLKHLVHSRHCSHTLDTPRPVPYDFLASILSAARYVTSASNSQPWSVTVIQGAARDKLSKAMLDHFDAGNDGGQTYKKYSAQNTSRMQKGKDQYGFELYEERHKLERDDKDDGRRKKYRPNYEFWGAPVLLLLKAPKTAAAGTFVDIGSYMYAILVGMQAYGLGGKPLGSVAKYTDICREVLGTESMPEDEHLVCGICIGWPSDGRDPREKPDWFPSRLPSEETSCWAVDD